MSNAKSQTKSPDIANFKPLVMNRDKDPEVSVDAASPFFSKKPTFAGKKMKKKASTKAPPKLKLNKTKNSEKETDSRTHTTIEDLFSICSEDNPDEDLIYETRVGNCLFT